MLFPERPKSLPYLADYLQHAFARRVVALPSLSIGAELAGSAAMGALVGWATMVAASGADLAAGFIAGVSAFAIGAYGAIRLAKSSSKTKPVAEDVRLAQDARAVVVRMHASMQKRRLHRDLTPEVAAVLEEAACQWSRARAALLSPYWTRTDLSPHMQSVREQCLSAIERAMQELLVLFATTVPEQPGSWNLAEVVDEVVGKSVFASPPTRHLSPFHGDAVNMAERLRDLADEAESISRQLVSDPNLGAQSRPGASLETTLSELRQLRQAEDELREDMRH